MGTETERKYLVNAGKWNKAMASESHIIEQGYILNSEEKTVRVRVYDQKGYITIKGKAEGITRPEFEYEIPLADARQLLKDFCGITIKKRRYKVLYRNNLWEVDEFFDGNEGLLLAEVEMEDSGKQLDFPEWIGDEVSNDRRYYNAWLSDHPFSSWK